MNDRVWRKAPCASDFSAALGQEKPFGVAQITYMKMKINCRFLGKDSNANGLTHLSVEHQTEPCLV